MPLSSTVEPTANSSHLQLRIPPAVAQALDLKAGQSLQWSVDGKGQALLRRAAASPGTSAAAAKKGARHC